MARDGNFILLKDVKVMMKNINLRVIVLEVGRPNITKEGNEVRTCKVADASGAMNLSVWNESGRYIQPSHILHVRNAYCGQWKNCPTIYTGKSGTIAKVGEFTMIYSEERNFSEPDPAFLAEMTAKANYAENLRKTGGQSTSRGDGSSPQASRHQYRSNRR